LVMEEPIYLYKSKEARSIKQNSFRSPFFTQSNQSQTRHTIDL
jgi:hypothetical protein